MKAYRLIHQKELTALDEALVQQGWKPGDFELQEDVFDPATAEVESALGEVGIRCLKTEVVTAYRVGPGLDWLRDFIDDLREGRMGSPAGGQS